MADSASQASDGSDFELDFGVSEDDLDDNNPVDHLDRAQAGPSDQGNDVDPLFSMLLDSDDSDDEFDGFQSEWCMDSSQHRNLNYPNCTNPTEQKILNDNPESALGYFMLFWTQEVGVFCAL